MPSRTGRTCRIACPVFAAAALALPACADEPAAFDPSTCGPGTRLRVDRVTVPHSNAAATTIALDLDGDDRANNQLGLVAGTLHNTLPDLDLTAAATTRLADDVTWYVTVHACEDDAAAAALTPTGDAATIQLVGTRSADGAIAVDGDDGAFPLSTMFDPTATIDSAGWLRATRARLELTPSGDGRWDGRVGMAFVVDEAIPAFARPLAPYFTATRNDLVMSVFDLDKDGVVTIEELETAPIMRSLFSADVGERGELGVSMAVGISAIED